jgi:hypothetical protein
MTILLQRWRVIYMLGIPDIAVFSPPYFPEEIGVGLGQCGGRFCALGKGARLAPSAVHLIDICTSPTPVL